MAEQTGEEREVQYLLAEHQSVCTEMNWRHSEHYRFIALSLIMLGVAGAFFGLAKEIVDPSVKILALAIVPFPFISVMALILKEHQYINMRDCYLEVVLRPRLEQLAIEPDKHFSWLGWQEFEHKQMGRQAGLQQQLQRFIIFMFLEIFDYGIPGLFAFGSLAVYQISRNQIITHDLISFADVFAIVNLLLLCLVVFIIIMLRFMEQQWYPKPPIIVSD